jgi:3-oxoacyl-(acyl-carrier-protein) synthase
MGVAITGMGAVSAAGLGAPALWESVMAGFPLSQNGICRLDPLHIERIQTTLANLGTGEVSFFESLALHAIYEAMQEAGWTELLPTDGLILGTTTGNLLNWETDIIEAGRTWADDATAFRRYEPLGDCVTSLRKVLKFAGPAQVITTACSSSAQAMALGTIWLKRGRVKRCLVGGVEVLSRLTVEGFRCLQLLSEKAATPFDQGRNGINLGEGAAFFCLERQASERALAGVAGYGMSSDAYHMTAPHPEGTGCYEAMKLALQSADLGREDISWIHAHGTGSVANDVSESLAIERLFGEEGPWVSSTKGVHGHALAASGALEVAIDISALRTGIVPRTLGLQSPDSRLKVRHPPAHLREPIRHILKNTLGFGGTNASLVISHPDEGLV